MELRQSVRMAARAISGHRLRAALTTLGIAIGIAAVITFVTLGASLKADIVGEVSTDETNSVYLVATPAEDDGPPEAVQPVFTEHDIGNLREVEGVARVIPRGTVSVSAVGYRNETLARSQVTATTPALFGSLNLTAGRAFEAGAREVVINGAAARSFEANVSVGDELRVVRRSGEPVNVTVVGTVEGGGGPFGAFSSQPRFYLPASEFYRKVVESPTAPGSPRQSVFPQVTVVAETGETEAVQSRVRAYLDESDARELAPSGYEVTARTNEDLVERVERVISRLTSFVTGIAVISLVVGAIGIANVMLVSVTERTKQIGVMKAVGARNRDVLQLFLVESVLLGLLGVLVGVPLGVASGWAAIRYVDLGRLVVPPTWFGIAVLVGVGVGVLAGLYPAWSAARTDPIEALRYE